MDKSTSMTIAVVAIVCVLLALFPWAGCSRSWQASIASGYGADWLVVQYSQDGQVIAHWELKDKSVASEQNSDGIYFVDNDGNVIHLSGHYIYVQIEGSWESARKRYLEGRLREPSE